MPRDSNGNASTDSVYVATPGTTIRAVQHNTPIADIIQMLTGSLARNGTGGMLADLAMGGFKITGLADGENAQDAITKAQLDAATAPGLPALGDWTNVSSASTVDLGVQTSRNIVITGTTTITSFGTSGAADNAPYLVCFAGALTLTHGASLILPGGANITTAAGDVAVVVHDTASVWRVIAYNRAAMPPLVPGTSANNLVALDGAGNLPAVDGSALTGLIKRATAVAASGQTSIDFTGIPSGARRVRVTFSGASTSGSSPILVRAGAGSVQATGYAASTILSDLGAGNLVYGASSSEGFPFPVAGASDTVSGSVTLDNHSGNTWVASVSIGNATGRAGAGGGSVTLSGALDRIRITTANGTDTFDAGSVNVFWE